MKRNSKSSLAWAGWLQIPLLNQLAFREPLELHDRHLLFHPAEGIQVEADLHRLAIVKEVQNEVLPRAAVSCSDVVAKDKVLPTPLAPVLGACHDVVIFAAQVVS